MNSSLEQIYSLQRTVGNRQVQQLLRSGVIQAKLTVNEPGDIYEQEADRIAERVLAVPTHSAGPQIQRMAGQSANETAVAPASVDRALASPGQPFEPGLRREMEQQFGWDFSGVRVHLGATADRKSVV